MDNSFQTLGAATEKARFSKLSFVLITISYCEIDYLSCLVIFERCRRPEIAVRVTVTSSTLQIELPPRPLHGAPNQLCLGLQPTWLVAYILYNINSNN